LTDDLNWVCWGPYWYPDGKHIVYAGADHSNPAVRPNYDLYWMNVESGKKVRLTYAPAAERPPRFQSGRQEDHVDVVARRHSAADYR